MANDTNIQTNKSNKEKLKNEKKNYENYISKGKSLKSWSS